MRLPADRLARARVVQWLSFEQERVMPGLGGTRFRRATGRAALDPAADAARFETGLAGLPNFINDQLTYPENARPGQGRSIYD